MPKAVPLLLLSTFLSTAASAQTFEQLTALRLSETSMSVRGAAMGAVADDDPSLNPASLSTFDKMMFSVGGMRSSYRREFFTNVSDELVTSERRAMNPTTFSHAMMAMPLGSSFTIGAWYRAEPELTGQEPAASIARDPFVPADCPLDSCVRVFIIGAGSFERRDIRYGTALSWERGPLSIGAGAEVQELREAGELLRSRPTFQPTLYDRVFLTAAGREIVPHAGIRWRVTPRIALAASYKGAGTFRRTREACYSDGRPVSGCRSERVLEGESEQTMPDSYRASVAIQPLDRLHLVVEAVRRNHTNLIHTDTISGRLITRDLRDATELHAGAEYRLGSVALRGGWWRDPARQNDFGVNPEFDFIRRRDHVTFGAGVNVGAASVDVAFDDVDDPALRRAAVGLRFGR